MTRKLPPLNALKAFEAAARHESFTKAAEELCVTPGAISKQIKILEEYVKMPLFERKPKQLHLTQSGERYLAGVRVALDMIESKTEQIFPEHGAMDVLHINTLPSLTSGWLIPLLEDFKRCHPAIQVTITTGDGVIDFDKTGADVAIRVTRQPTWKQLFVEKLADEELLPIYSPHLAAKSPPLQSPQDLAHYNLLQHSSRPTMWKEYLTAIGYETLEVKHTLGFEHFFMLIEAAKDELGIALIPRFLIEKELLQGSLAIAFKSTFRSPYSYYLLASKQKAELKKVRAFRKWIKEKIAKNLISSAPI